MLHHDSQRIGRVGSFIAATLLAASACAPHSTFTLRSSHEVHGEVISSDLQTLIVEEHSGGRVRVQKCVIADASYAGGARQIVGGALLGVATVITGVVAAEQVRRDERYESEGYRYSSNQGVNDGYVVAGGMAIAGGILLFTGLNQEATARERAGKIECVAAAPPTDSADPVRERSPLPPTR